jgi:hypothetical protein
MPVRVTCSSCGTSLTVADSAPTTLTCPRCLAKIQRPAAIMAHTPPPLPLRALPLDEEAESDTKLALPVIVLISIFVVFGLCIMIVSFPQAQWQLISVAAATLVILGLMAWVFRGPKSTVEGKQVPAGQSPMAAPPIPDLGQPLVLNYRPAFDRPPTRAGWFVGGFFIAIGVCAGGFVLLGMTAANTMNNNSASNGGNIIYLFIVLFSVVAMIWMAVRINHNPRM